MAADLKDTPRAGLTVQLCGDAHLSNFGVFASPERALLFDLNDFDETLPGPFEYDVKRMSASFTIAGRNNGFSKAETGRPRRRPYGPTGRRWPTSPRWARWTSGTRASLSPSSEAIKQLTQRPGAKKARRSRGRRARRSSSRRRGPATACRRCPSWRRKWTVSTASSTSRRSWSRSGSSHGSGMSPDELAHADPRASSARTERRCRTTGATCWSASRSSTSPARSSGSAASARGRSSSCCRVATRRIRSSCR